MRRPFRILINVAAMASAMLFLAGVGAWGYSFRQPVLVPFETRGERCQLVIRTGRASIDNEPQHAAYLDDVAARMADLLIRGQAIDERDKRIPHREAGTYVFSAAEAAAFERRNAEIDALRAPVERDQEALSKEWEQLNGVIAARPSPWRREFPPYALPLAALPFAVAPALVIYQRTRLRRRRRKGLCAACGYDLRATRARCPECGRQAVSR